VCQRCWGVLLTVIWWSCYYGQLCGCCVYLMIAPVPLARIAPSLVLPSMCTQR
jgi:hypothetical protein